ncbi:MFS transporter [Dongshaea marina]|uniref:MFS transporter n=1 Tax=Dongshaea marina TaxID=2047966 RepID=UPI000D3E0BD1|nr:MFS transporter [Dongshaea marina]
MNSIWLKALHGRSKLGLFVIMAAAMTLSFTSWRALLNNFAVEQVMMNGSQMGLLQSFRELPGFLCFSIILVLLVIREQRLALISLAVLGAGVAITGYFPTLFGIIITTLIMSTGFHYFQTLNASLSMQLFEANQYSHIQGILRSAGSAFAIITFILVWLLLTWLNLSFRQIMLICGLGTIALCLYAALRFPHFLTNHPQKMGLVLRKRYWLYYLLTFFSGARRQIFVVFASFLMVTKFNFSAAHLTLLFLANNIITMIFAPMIGKTIGKIGEKPALLIEYVGLILVFVGYALVEHQMAGAALYIADNLLFALSIALNSYFKRIASPDELASSSGVAFSINHIAAVVIPVSFGILWMHNEHLVFWLAALLACGSLLLALLLPRHAAPGNETIFSSPQAEALPVKES